MQRIMFLIFFLVLKHIINVAAIENLNDFEIKPAIVGSKELLTDVPSKVSNGKVLGDLKMADATKVPDNLQRPDVFQVSANPQTAEAGEIPGGLQTSEVADLKKAVVSDQEVKKERKRRDTLEVGWMDDGVQPGEVRNVFQSSTRDFGTVSDNSQFEDNDEPSTINLQTECNDSSRVEEGISDIEAPNISKAYPAFLLPEAAYVAGFIKGYELSLLKSLATMGHPLRPTPEQLYAHQALARNNIQMQQIRNPSLHSPQQVSNPSLYMPQQIPNPSLYKQQQIPIPSLYNQHQIPNPSLYRPQQIPDPSLYSAALANRHRMLY